MLMLIILIAFPFLIWKAYKKVGLAKASAAWPGVPGIVTASGRTKSGWRTQPLVTYSYEVDGKAYTSTKVSPAEAVPAKETDPILSRYPVQTPVTVHYQPSDPSIAFLEPGPNRLVSNGLKVFIIWYAFIILLNIANVGLHVWQANEAASEPPIHTYGDDSTPSPTAASTPASPNASTAAAPSATPDLQRGNQLLREDADKGDAKAQRYVAIWYFAGKEGYPKDPVKAAEWMRKSADQGDPEAENFMGQFYASGTGVEKNLETAVQWLQKAAAQGEPHACFSLGTASEKGLGGLPQDNAKAIEWYRKAGNLPKAHEALVRLHAAW
ncbi:MAG: DUF3592 domain-containing protein [Chthoniobacteraceae bacterium]